ncbi:MAG: sensor histidine kinase [Oscillospiraceae bacterium]|nr:sensor histidine kinase [Oscillospiraceae bacterium]
MDGLSEKLVAAMICAVGFCTADSLTAPVALLLLSLCISAAVTLLPKQYSTLSAAMIAADAALSLWFPLAVCGLPLLLYDALTLKKWWLVLPGCPALFIAGKSLLLTQYLAIAVGCAASLLLFRRISRLTGQVSRLTELRDSVTERNLMLAEQNLKMAQMQDAEIHLATMKERNRIAREIHDNVGHMLTRALLQAGALTVINRDEQMREPLIGLKDTLDTAMTSMRESVHTLHDDSIDLRKVIADSIGTVGDRFSVKLDYDISDRVPGSVKLCIAGVIKEGLSNAVKHSAGDRILIVVREHPAFYQLVIEDNGRCTEIAETGIGLKNMTDRVKGVGGQISFTPSEKGFRIFASLQKEKP